MAFYERYESRLQEAKNHFRENFPVTYIRIHVILMVLLSLAIIGIQIGLLAKRAYLASIANGIWSGLISLFAALTAYYLSKLDK